MNPSSPRTHAIVVIKGVVFTEKKIDARIVDDSPMEKALRFVEKRTDQPREKWEHKIGHPFVRAANALAKRLAGVPESRSVKGAPAKPINQVEN